MQCSNCGNQLSANDMFCNECGTKVDHQQRQECMQSEKKAVSYCANCGSEMFSDDVFCANCGAPVRASLGGEYCTSESVYYTDTESGGYKTTKKKNTGLVVAVIITVVAVLGIAAAAVWYVFSDDIDYSGDDDSGSPRIEETERPKKEPQPTPTAKPKKKATPEPTASPTPDPREDSEYIYPTDEMYITDDELDDFSRDEVRLILNEMYARHGYIFQREEYYNYFSEKDWYHPRYSDQGVVQSYFNKYEEANRLTIIDYEERKGWR